MVKISSFLLTRFFYSSFSPTSPKCNAKEITRENKAHPSLFLSLLQTRKKLSLLFFGLMSFSNCICLCEDIPWQCVQKRFVSVALAAKYDAFRHRGALQGAQRSFVPIFSFCRGAMTCFYEQINSDLAGAGTPAATCCFVWEHINHVLSTLAAFHHNRSYIFV